MTSAVRLQARCSGADAEPDELGERGVWRALRSDADAFFKGLVLRGTQRISTVCPTAGAQALVMSHVVCHDMRASQGQHCTAECRFSLCEH